MFLLGQFWGLVVGATDLMEAKPGPYHALHDMLTETHRKPWPAAGERLPPSSSRAAWRAPPPSPPGHWSLRVPNEKSHRCAPSRWATCAGRLVALATRTRISSDRLSTAATVGSKCRAHGPPSDS